MHQILCGISFSSFQCIKRILGLTSPDEEILTWLQAQLSIHCYDKSITKSMENERDRVIEYLKTDPKEIQFWKLQAAILMGLPYDEKLTAGVDPNLIEELKEIKKMLDLPVGKVPEILRKLLKKEVALSSEELKELKEEIHYTEETKKEIKELLTKSNEELLEHAQRSYDRFLYFVIRIIESELPYDHKYNEIERLDKQRIQDIFDSGNLIDQYSNISVRMYEIQVRYQAHFNIMKSAIEIYIVKAKTGKLPEKLPEFLPKDPLSGQDFIYEITSEGFSLKTPVDINTRNSIHSEFKVPKK
jgi:hypothetical protein